MSVPQPNMLAQALLYAGAGVHVFPVNIAKEPLTGRGGFHHATTARGQIERWWKQWPDAGIATPDFDVVDVDLYRPKCGPTWKRIQLLIPEGTPHNRTGRGGVQFFFAPGTLREGKIGPGVDCRYAGRNYVLLPPSRNEGGYYEAVVDLLHRRAKPAPDFPSHARDGAENGRAAVVDDVIPAGGRNETLASLAGSMRRRGMGEAEILAALQVTNRDRCRPPLPDRDVGRIASSISRYAPADAKARPSEGASGRESTSKSRTLTDDGNAYRLVDLHGQDLRYVPGAGWYAWDGTRWLHDSSGEPMRRAREVAERLREEAKLRISEHGKDDDLGKAMVAHAKASASRRGLDAMLAIARSDRRVIVDVAELDADPLLLNTPNGTINLKTGQLRPHERGDLITRRVAVPYDPDAAAPTWSTFLERVLPAVEVREYAQRMVGAAAIGDNRDELVHVSYGPGANGKTKFSETIRTCLGDYAATVDPELFLAQRGRSAAQPELARLRGVRLVTAAETEEGRPAGVIYGAWRDWCQKHGEEPGSAKAFGMRLEDAGYPATRLTDGNRARAGLQLRGSTKRQTQ